MRRPRPELGCCAVENKTNSEKKYFRGHRCIREVNITSLAYFDNCGTSAPSNVFNYDNSLENYFYSKTNKMHQCIKLILFWNDTLHVSDGPSVHHQEFKTVHTATGICQTDTAV